MNIQCPSCNTTLRAPDDSVGKRFRCPKCSTVLTVPAETPAVPQMPPDPNPFPTPQVPQQQVPQQQIPPQVPQQQFPQPQVPQQQIPQQPVPPQFPQQPVAPQQPYPQQPGAPQPFQPAMGADNPYAYGGGGGANQYGTASKSAGSDIGWHSVAIGFSISTVALLISSIGLVLLMLATLAGMSGSGSAFLANVVIWGGAAVFGAFFAMLAGWFVCVKAPKQSETVWLATWSVVCMCIALGLLIIIAPAMATGIGMTRGRASMREFQTLAQLIQWMTLISSTGGLSLFGFFASKVAQLMGNRGVSGFALANVCVQGGVLLWFAIMQMGVFKVRSSSGVITMLVITFLLMIASQVVLMLTVNESRKCLVRRRPW